MVPHVALQRRHVEVADQDHLAPAQAGGLGPGCHLAQELELVGELVVALRVRLVAALGHVEAVHLGPARQAGEGVAPVIPAAPGAGAGLVELDPRQDGDAVVALLAVDHEMGIAERGHRLAREGLVGGLGLLQADHVGRHLVHEARQVVEPLAHRVDVPGRQAQAPRWGLGPAHGATGGRKRPQKSANTRKLLMGSPVDKIVPSDGRRRAGRPARTRVRPRGAV